MGLGRVAEQRGHDDVVDREFEMALTGLSANGMTERLLRCHGMYAEILERRGDLQTSYLHKKKGPSASKPGPLRGERHQNAEGARVAQPPSRHAGETGRSRPDP